MGTLDLPQQEFYNTPNYSTGIDHTQQDTSFNTKCNPRNASGACTGYLLKGESLEW